jgi:DNA-directed RNA polymerase specialized sigma24 family protein
MTDQAEAYVPCHRCHTKRPRSKLLAGACNDGFCARVFETTNAAEAHKRWWVGRYPYTSFLAEDIRQESSLAAWRASETFDPKRGVLFGTYAFGPMHTAVRTFLRRQFFFQPRRVGDVYEQYRLASPDEARADRPTLLRAATEELIANYKSRGATGRAVPVLLMLEMGDTQSDAARAAGVSRQYVNQVLERYGDALADVA